MLGEIIRPIRECRELVSLSEDIWSSSFRPQVFEIPSNVDFGHTTGIESASAEENHVELLTVIVLKAIKGGCY